MRRSLLLAGAVAMSVVAGCGPAASRQIPAASAQAVGAEREISLEVQELT